MDRLMPFDQLNKLEAGIRETFAVGMQKKDKRAMMDEILDLLILSYLYGDEAAYDMLDLTAMPADPELIDAALTKKVAGKTWVERVGEYIDNGTPADVIRVVETDAHRIYNQAIYNVGSKAAAAGQAMAAGVGGGQNKTIYKRWETMLDERVRDTHEYLEGTEVPFGERFYTYDGDSALHPADFTLPQNNVNCRCRIKLTRK